MARSRDDNDDCSTFSSVQQQYVKKCSFHFKSVHFRQTIIIKKTCVSGSVDDQCFVNTVADAGAIEIERGGDAVLREHQ